MLEALCGDKGPRVPRGPSLSRYEASDLKELVMQEPALPDRGLSEWLTLVSQFGKWSVGVGARPHGTSDQAPPVLS